MKVALSASYWDVPAVTSLLGDCEVIYTTNVQARDELWRLFGRSVVHFVPTTSGEWGQFIRSGHPGAEFIDFPDLRECVRDRIHSGDQAAMWKILKRTNWVIRPVLLSDEEGIEGHRFCLGDLEYYGVGDEIPDSVQLWLVRNFC